MAENGFVGAWAGAGIDNATAEGTLAEGAGEGDAETGAVGVGAGVGDAGGESTIAALRPLPGMAAISYVRPPESSITPFN